MASFENLSGLAGEIRASTSSEQFDLAGYTEERARQLIQNAFGAPLTAPTEMIRFTFVVGGGKLVRSRYNDDMTKWLTSALRDVGYSDDRSAAETFDSQGTYKQQHDTGQNLKYLIVYPRVTCSEVKEGGPNGEGESGAEVDTSSPEYIVNSCEMSTFMEIVGAKVQSWQQKQRLQKCIEETSSKFKAVEEKLMQGVALTPAEQAIYDANSGVDDEKLKWLKAEASGMVERGRLTAAEKQTVEQMLADQIVLGTKLLMEATEQNKPKRMEKLSAQKQLLEKKLEEVKKITPIVYTLKHAEEIVKLRIKMCALSALEDKGRSVSLTLADLKALEEKFDIEDRIQGYERASRGWFDTEEEFQPLCDALAKEARTKYAAKVKSQGGGKKVVAGKSGTQGRTGGGASSWAVAGSTKKAGYSSSSAAKKPSGGGRSGGFAAAFGDSDSD
jgi:hypothetical protein